MSDKIIENNQVTIMGEIASDFTFSHEVFGEGFYGRGKGEASEQLGRPDSTDDFGASD